MKKVISNKHLLFHFFSTIGKSHDRSTHFHLDFSSIQIGSMATASNKTMCFLCKKMQVTYICQGCSNHFCFDHLLQHRTDIQQQFDFLQNNHDQLRQQINDTKSDPTKHSLIKQIDQWERDSINKIQEHAQQCKTRAINQLNSFVQKIEKKLKDLAEQIKGIHQENAFNEIDLNNLKEKLEKLEKELNRPSNIFIKRQSTLFVDNISVLLLSGKTQMRLSLRKDLFAFLLLIEELFLRTLHNFLSHLSFSSSTDFLLCLLFHLSFVDHLDMPWKQLPTTIAGGYGQGNRLDQLNFPYSICVDDHNEMIYTVDSWNNRIVQWNLNRNIGRIVIGGNEQGSRLDQLNQPRDVIIDRENNDLIIADEGNRRVLRCSVHSNSPAQIIIDDIDCYCLAMHEDGTLYVSDQKKNEVQRWKKGERRGTIVAGGNGQGNQLNQLNNPSFLFICDDHTLYISDWGNHRVIKWERDAKTGRIVAGGNGQGYQLTQLSGPQGVIVDQCGQIYVADGENNRVMQWCEGEKEGRIVIGGNGHGQEKNQLNRPTGLSFDGEGSLYVADYWNHRIEKLERDFG